MGITDYDIICQYEGAKEAKALFAAAEGRLAQLNEGSPLNVVTEEAAYIYEHVGIRHPNKASLEQLMRQCLLARDYHLDKARSLSEARDREDAKTFFGRRRIKRRQKERDRYIKQQQRKRSKAKSKS